MALLGTSGCSSLKFWDKDKGDKVIEGSPEQLYRDAIQDIKNNNYPGAIQRYEMLEARYPFSEQAKQGQLDLIYAYYKNRSADAAIDQADQFIRENPTHPRVDYAYYVRGLVYFESGANWLERKFKADIAKRPPHEASKSFQAFQVLVQQYPKSPYAADARQRMIFLRNRLADYEIAVARFYLKRGAYVGAANRAKGVITGYDGAPAVDDALKILAAAYRRLELDDLAQVADNVRTANAYTVPDQMALGGTAAGWDRCSGNRGRQWWRRMAARRCTAAGRAMGSHRRRHRLQFERRRLRRRHDGRHRQRFRFHGRSRLSLHRSPAGRVDLHVRPEGLQRRRRGRHAGRIVCDEGSLDTMSLMFDAAYTFLTGPLTPYVVGGVGWAWVDTNIASAPPEVGCWWHPWWGYICTSWQDTRTVDGLAYEVGIGMRYNFSNSLAADGAYRMRWMDFENATGTPSFDTLQLNLVWKF